MNAKDSAPKNILKFINTELPANPCSTNIKPFAKAPTISFNLQKLSYSNTLSKHFYEAVGSIGKAATFSQAPS